MTDKDRELLEKAANAAGVNAMWRPNVCEGGEWFAVPVDNGWLEWNPLTHNDDALQLLARLRLSVDYRPGFVGVHKGFGPYIGQCPHDEDAPLDSAATRRAIVRAAASIGEKL